MSIMPDSMRLTETEQSALDAIKAAAKIRHEKARKAARRKGRVDFPMFPFECSAAFENQFRRDIRK